MEDVKLDEFQNVNDALRLYRIGSKDIENIRAFKSIADKSIPESIDAFYEWLPNIPEFTDLFSRPGLIDHVKKLQIAYWEEFFACDLNKKYVAYRIKIGQIHARIKLPLYSYVASMSFVVDWWAQHIESLELDNKIDLLVSLNKQIQFDIAIVLAAYAYAEKTTELLEQQNQTLLELSTPAIQLWENVLVLPIVGILDSKRAQAMTDTMLGRVVETEAKIVIIDIVGVPTVDSGVANHLIKITKATRLMGCDSILSGISPEIAQTLVQLGAKLEEIETVGTLRDAFQLALNKMNLVIKETLKK